jgi:hypothetical protein
VKQMSRTYHRQQQCHKQAINVDKQARALRWASRSMSR